MVPPKETGAAAQLDPHHHDYHDALSDRSTLHGQWLGVMCDIREGQRIDFHF